jgi:hypothetical protein
VKVQRFPILRFAARLTVVGLALNSAAACKEERLQISPGSDHDYHSKDVTAAVNTFVTNGRTPAAYAALATEIGRMRSTMDAAVAAEAELKLVAAAWTPLQSVVDKSPDEQADVLATTVWPVALRESIRQDTLLFRGNSTDSKLLALANETGTSYLQRICGDALRSVCFDVVPEFQAVVVRQLVVHRFNERLRSAVSACVSCNDAAWRELVRKWEVMDASITETSRSASLQGQPLNWPVAGASSGPMVPSTESALLKISSVGELSIGNRRINTIRRDRQFRELVGNLPLLVHALPTVRVAELRDITADAAKADIRRVGVVARSAIYPWSRRVYWLSVGSGVRVPIRGTDTVQALLQALDDADLNTARLD